MVSRIRVLALDIDGVLTDGRASIAAEAEEQKRYSFHDLDGLNRAKREGLTLALVTGEQNLSAEAIATRFPNALVIGGDQVPATSTTILDKPGNAANCREQLKLLSGSTAEFYTACTVRCVEAGVKL